MSNNSKVVNIFTIPIQFPCGPQSSCCGPIGQSEEKIQSLKSSIEKELGCRVGVINVMNGSEMRNYLPIARLVQSFGPVALPIVTLDGEVISMGNPTPEEAVLSIREKIKQA